jgi:hypothetical protein
MLNAQDTDPAHAARDRRVHRLAATPFADMRRPLALREIAHRRLNGQMLVLELEDQRPRLGGMPGL